MKASLIIIFIAISFLSNAQPYQSYLENVDTWHLLMDAGMYEGTTVIVQKGRDTLLNEKEYIKLLFESEYSELFYEQLCNPECSGHLHNDMYIREDSLHEKLYLYSGITSREYIISDLSLTLNDTIILRNENTIQSFTLIPKRIFFEGGRKIIEFENINKYELHSNIKLQYIEGIGSNWGFLHRFNTLNNLLLCSSKGDELTFKITENTECYYQWVGDDCLDPCTCMGICTSIQHHLQPCGFENIRVQQNHHYITFEFLDENFIYLELYNLHGQLIWVSEIHDTNINIPKESLNNGLLIYRCLSHKNIESGKVLLSY